MSKRIKTILTFVLALVSALSVMSFVACGYVATCNHNYVNGVCTYCNERDPSWAYEVTITNKEDLTAQWLEASATRELAVKVTYGGGEVSDANYVVETSNAGVVSVGDDNKTLTATGEGTATITAKMVDYDGTKVSDSVEITVTPYLRGVEISNKEELTAVWVLGDEARQLGINFKPEYYNQNKPEYTVTSSDPTVVEVGADKVTLTAKKVGTATITLATGEFSDTVELLVRPELESLTLTNKADLQTVWNDWNVTRTIEVAMEPADYYTTDNTDVQVTCTPANLVSVNGLTLTAKAVGELTVTVTVGTLSQTFTVEIKRSAPTINFAEVSGFTQTAEGGDMGGFAGQGVTLPEFTARTCDGSYVTNNVTMTLLDTENATLKNGVLTADKGTYRVQYQVADTENDELVTEKIVTVTVARSVLGTQDNTWVYVDGKAYVDDDEQALKVNTYGYQLASFNMEPSKYYYAEATFYTSEYLGGMSHFSTNGGKVDIRRSLLSQVGNADNNYKLIDFDTYTSWNMQEGNGELQVVYQWRLREYWQHTELAESKVGARVSKMGIARIGEYFISFWNDQYVLMYADDYYSKMDTVPGLFVTCYTGSLNSVSKITYFSGEEATTAKVKELTHNGKDLNANYVPAEFAFDSQNIDNRNFTSGEYTEAKGINYEFTKNNAHFNGGMTSNNVWFDGDFTYQWDYKANKASSNDARSIIELRGIKWYDEYGIQFGASYDKDASGNAVYNRSLLNANKNATGSQWWEGASDLDASEGVRFTLSRKLYNDYAAVTMTTSSIAKPWQTFTRTVNFGKTADKSSDGKTAYANWDEPVTVQWHNTNLAGEYTNITWKNSATEHASHVYSKKTTTWSEDNSECTITLACCFDGCTEVYATETVTVTSQVTTAQSCVNDEVTTYTATCTNSALGTVTKKVTTADKLGHHMVDVEAKDATTEGIGWNDHKACDREGCDYKEGYVEKPQLESPPQITLAETQGLEKTADGYKMSAFAGEALTLPEATAKSYLLVDITANIQIRVLEDGATIVDGKLNAPQGTYTVEYSVTDADELTNTLEVKVSLYRKVIGTWSDGSFSYAENGKYVADAQQTIVNKTNGFQFMALNVTPSDYYYAEVEYSADNYYGGMAHFKLKEDGNIFSGRPLVTIANGTDINFKITDFDTSKAWSVQENDDTKNMTIYAYGLKRDFNMSENAKCTGSTKVSKFAIARVGANFMTFWNDQYVMTYVSDYFSEGNTVPGLFLIGANSISASNISWVTGKEATYAKIQQVTDNGKGFTRNFLQGGGFKDSLNVNNNRFIANEYTEERGLNFDVTTMDADFNGAMVSNYVWFEGDFTYQWDYVGVEAPAKGTDWWDPYRAVAEIRSRYGYRETTVTPTIRFGVQWNNNDGTAFGFNRFILHAAAINSWSEPTVEGFDASKGVRFTLSRKLLADRAVYTLTAASIAKPTQVFSREIIASDNTSIATGGYASTRWNDVVTVQWHNNKIKGNYSNVTWTNSAN